MVWPNQLSAKNIPAFPETEENKTGIAVRFVSSGCIKWSARPLLL
jgi:hypothetical protein